MVTPTLDFIVIGAQKGGTTSLWQYLREHPRLYLPKSKEAPAFTVRVGSSDEFAAYMRNLFGEAPPDSLLGKVTPAYMIGQPGVQVEVVAERIAAEIPAVKLIAVLRDPIERAVSSYMMAVRREQEKRSIDSALCDLLRPEELADARFEPSDDNTYIVAGEYGRILSAYRASFPADQMLTVFTEDLADDPGAVLDEVLDFLGLPSGFRPKGLGVRHFRGGRRKLLDPQSEELLLKFHREEVLPHLRGSPSIHNSAFSFFYDTWNVAPESRPPVIEGPLRARLEAHFRADAEHLRELDVDTPWIARWESRAASEV
jgi:hypothetical protein